MKKVITAVLIIIGLPVVLILIAAVTVKILDRTKAIIKLILSTVAANDPMCN
jgi:hypothetical protein